ncbi:MAG: hypothetical protein JJU45_12290, partial [Acidimicrobiia bacterium]|nr:hypothetical protein [Acidimicrobiia bacterium]
GVQPHVVEAAEVDEAHRRWAALVTVGLVDPLECAWGRRPVRFARRRWAAPLGDLDGVAAPAPAVGRGVDGRWPPTRGGGAQPRGGAAAGDGAGWWWPSVPAVAVVPHRTEDLWRALAVLCAPPVAALLAAQGAGSGMGRGTMRISARSLREVALPVDEVAWSAAADLLAARFPPDTRVGEALTAGRPTTTADSEARPAPAWRTAERRVDLEEFGRLMCRAYGQPLEDVLPWWLAGLPDADRRR